MGVLDLSSLEKAVALLQGALADFQDERFVGGLTPSQKRLVMSGVVQNFEFTYELCWKFLQRWVQVQRSEDEAQTRTRKDLYRLAARLGLIADPLPWFEYADARNLTSHTYDQERAQQVIEVALRFIADASALLTALKANND